MRSRNIMYGDAERRVIMTRNLVYVVALLVFFFLTFQTFLVGRNLYTSRTCPDIQEEIDLIYDTQRGKYMHNPLWSNQNKDDATLNPHRFENPERPLTETANNVFDEISDSRLSDKFEEDQIHLSTLKHVCVATNDLNPLIPWQYNPKQYFDLDNPNEISLTVDKSQLHLENDKGIAEVIANCPPVDIFLPVGIRGHGYCEDAVAYLKYLKSRILPYWVFTNKFPNSKGGTSTYFELCPHTPLIVFAHYTDGILELPGWPKQKPIIWMPNIEMYENTKELIQRMDLIICKTVDCGNRMVKWFTQNGNPRNTKVFYTRHVSSDSTAVVRYYEKTVSKKAVSPPLEGNRLGLSVDKFKNIEFLHVPGRSIMKGTRELLSCWKKSPSFPMLTLVGQGESFDFLLREGLDGSPVPNNVKTLKNNFDPIEFGKMLSNTPSILCPSIKEGYGHYINQARAAGAVILTTDHIPMNELVDNESGVLLPFLRYTQDTRQIFAPWYEGENGLKGVKGLDVEISDKDVCDGVKKIINMSPEERLKLAVKSRKRYEDDAIFFKKSMIELSMIAFVALQENYPDIRS